MEVWAGVGLERRALLAERLVVAFQCERSGPGPLLGTYHKFRRFRKKLLLEVLGQN